VPVLLAAAAAACLVGVPRQAGLRLHAVVPRRSALSSGQRWADVVPGLPAGRSPIGAAAAAVLLAAGLLLGRAGLVPVALAAAALAVLVRVRRGRRAAAAREVERSRAVEACGTLAAELRAGRTPAEALDAAAELAAGPFARSLAAGASAVRLGGDVASALRPSPDTSVPGLLRALAACWTVCAGSGGGLAAAVERLEQGCRAEQAQRRSVQAELAGPRATAGLLAVLPAGGLLLAAGLGADPLSVLLSTPLGLACLAVGLALDATGVWWTGRLVASAGGRV
jgi:tight adherence protein B